MIKFNPEEISLCKQVAKKHKKEIGKGDWYISEDSDYKTGWSNPMLNFSDYAPVKKKLPGIFDDKDRNDIPLWTISDCLEFLGDKIGVIELWRTGRTLKWMFRKGDQKWWSAKTPLKACLRAVLAVLEEGK